MNTTQLLILLLTGLLSGVLSGFVGVGGGIVVIPMLIFFLGYSQQLAQGTTLAMLLPPIGLLATINYYKAGYVDLKAAMLMVITFVIGSYFSSKVAVQIPTDLLRKIFAIFLFLVAIYLFIKK
ncbi:sulfite exporter TauE/SafE family protein [Melioribacteraceae bacterium 4301-Me]|uniref:sulfite exporter TauE/SafE family protein n=1 Tax=Pyranulibacter aquaticus TaxID=3163344 RepID=UPI003599B04F